jgi:hypothetical protein
MWFEELTGFAERDVDDVAAQFRTTPQGLVSIGNGRVMRPGRFDTPTLAELRDRLPAGLHRGPTAVTETVADAQQLHVDPSNAGAVFQVASQFNALEMISPGVTPDDGIDIYERDPTQGPACAIACGPGTIYRNYLIPLDGGTGQTATRQLNLLADLTGALGVEIDMRNGYALPTDDDLDTINERLGEMTDTERTAVMGTLRVGVQSDTEVTLAGGGHTVTQVFCSALPVAYGTPPQGLWEPFARLVLDAGYEATLTIAALNAARCGDPRVFLTLVGGGAFGNRPEWILDAIGRSLRLFADSGLEVTIVSYRSPNSALTPLLTPTP